MVAETFEQARAAAALVRVDYTRAKDGRFDLARQKRSAVEPKGDPDTGAGDFEAGFAAAPVKLDATYTTPDQAHAMMEPHASIAPLTQNPRVLPLQPCPSHRSSHVYQYR